MYIEQLYTGCLAEAAYYIESEGEAVIIDPIRETSPYLEMAAARGSKIKYIFETHFHADFVSGHIDLAAETGATIVYGPGANPKYDAHIAHDGERFQIGKISFEVLHTPGHTLESSCFLLRDENGKENAIFTGDTLFVGAVGRPDLAVKGERIVSPEELGSLMFDSLQNKIMPLADDVLVYPAHGPGSSCGKGIGKETWSTIGVQKATNYALQPMSREEFIHQVTENLPPPPAYFFEDARINQTGYDSIDSVMLKNSTPLSPEDAKAALEAGAIVLDTRTAPHFEKAFIKGAINIGLNGGFAVWVGTLMSISEKLVVVADVGRESESIMRLARVGFENIVGFLQGGMASWTAKGYRTEHVETVAPETIPHHLQAANSFLLDVRKPSEFASGHVIGAKHFELDFLEKNLNQLDPEANYVVHCQGGYRSMIAASIMKANGFRNVKNIDGGYGAIAKTEVPTEEGSPAMA